MTNEIRAEVRGIRLIVGALVMVVFTKWYFTGRVFDPLADWILQSIAPVDVDAYGGPLGDIADVATAIAYVVGTAACLGIETAWKFARSALGVVADRLRGVRSIADLYHGRQWEELSESDSDIPDPDGPAESSADDASDSPGAMLAAIAGTVNKLVFSVNEHDERLQRLSDDFEDLGDEVRGMQSQDEN
ncbi:hypothetical protein [Roseiconus lacunae]|uniref:DUF1232 domain-containing protein n=1 Tax=Roseiconus lacunae TaxID=2605694 RepID=A0ABT7PEM9_9BACT|nr:hypothetical protein [Roseiconus lacunae]MDM4014950.1 hypothetical protein [Roseiconus lacunae]